MSHAYGSKEGAAYLIDPLTAPEPSQETGLGSHFGSTMPHSSKPAPVVTATSSRSPSSPSSSTNPFRKASISSKDGHNRTTSREIHHGSPGGSPKPFPKYREAAFGDLNEGRRRSGGASDHPPPNYTQTTGESSHRRRTSSLTARYPGDNSHKPLDIIRRDSKKAHRSPHLNKRHIPGADTIDRLDPTLNSIPYHHEGPYDAALLARNNDPKTSPIAAVADSNREALKATPAENIRDALERHKPIEGVASVPPGETDRLGRVYHYEEGTDMMRDPNAPGGPYKQWAGADYTRDDIGGKGDPLDQAMKNHSIRERDFDGQRGIELSSQPLMSGHERHNSNGQNVAFAEGSGSGSGRADVDSSVNRTSSLRKAGEGLKKRLSIKKKFREIHDGEVD